MQLKEETNFENETLTILTRKHVLNELMILEKLVAKISAKMNHREIISKQKTKNLLTQST